MTNSSSVKGKPPSENERMIERLVERKNMEEAYWKVIRNKGAAGIDNMTVAELKPYLTEKWASIKEKLLNGQYKPKPVRRVMIPKPGGGERQLGIPTVVDRLI